ncbi:MAG: hypothetical protein V4689_08705 [Verrucomicrobiota bacterium]
MKKLFLALVAVAVIFVIGAAISGHPIYGERFVVDNRPLLKNPSELSRLDDPNIVITETGERLAVEGIVFEDGVSALPPEELSRCFMDSNPIRLVADLTRTSGVAFEWKIGYFCGNSFRPARFFPKPLPGYQIADFGHALVMRGMARELDNDEATNLPFNGSTNQEGNQAVAPNRSLVPILNSTSSVRGQED